MTEIGLIGSGRVGRALVSLLPPESFRVGAVMDETLTVARRAVREISRGTATADVESFRSAQVILICLPSGAIGGAVRKLADATFLLQRRVVLHTCGTYDSSVLRPLRRRGAATGSMHPLYVFQRPVLSFAGVYFAAEGDTAANRMAQRIVRALQGEFQLVRPGKKIHSSVAASLASDCLTGLLEIAVGQMTAAGLPRRRAWEAVARILDATQQDYAHSGRKSRPGPLLEDDTSTVEHFVEELSRRDPAAAEGYQLAARQTLLALRGHTNGFDFLDTGSDAD